jgi:hypothetical protein
MTLVMYDSIDVSQMAGLSMDAAAGYVDGAWPTYPTLGQHVPSGTILLSITVFGNPADCVDQEPGNIEVGPAAEWVANRIQQGHWRPVVYTSASNMDNMTGALAAVGVGKSEVRLWSAHYTHSAHICAPNVCGFPSVDGTQWTDKAHGRNLDQSELLESFFIVDPSPPEPIPGKVDGMERNLNVGANAKTAVAFPYGSQYIRLLSNGNAQFTIDWRGETGTTSNPDATVSPEHISQWKIPAGIQGAVFKRRDSGTDEVSLAVG